MMMLMDENRNFILLSEMIFIYLKSNWYWEESLVSREWKPIDKVKFLAKLYDVGQKSKQLAGNTGNLAHI